MWLHFIFSLSAIWVLLPFLIITGVYSNLIKDFKFELDFTKQGFVSVEFDSSFYNILFIENRISHQLLRIRDLGSMTTKNIVINITSQIIFSGLLNTGNIVLICKNNRYLDGYSIIEMPEISAFLKENHISNMSTFNDFNHTVLAVYNVNKISCQCLGYGLHQLWK